jgi:phosphate transport system permease protein
MHSKRMSLMANPRTVLSSQLISALLWLCAALVTGIFAWILIDILRLGLAHLSLDFLLSEPTRAGRSGGIAPIIVSTLWVLAIALTVALPLGLGSALWLHSFTAGGGRLSRTVRVLLDILAGVPSIVFGLFGAACFCIWMGMGFSILSGGLTLACMILPLLIRTTEMGLAAVPADWQRGALALGLSRTAALRCGHAGHTRGPHAQHRTHLSRDRRAAVYQWLCRSLPGIDVRLWPRHGAAYL